MNFLEIPRNMSRVLYLYGKDQKLDGVIGLAVDGIAGGGSKEFQAATGALTGRFPFTWKQGEGNIYRCWLEQDKVENYVYVIQAHFARSLEHVPIRKQEKARREEERETIGRGMKKKKEEIENYKKVPTQRTMVTPGRQRTI